MRTQDTPTHELGTYNGLKEAKVTTLVLKSNATVELDLDSDGKVIGVAVDGNDYCLECGRDVDECTCGAPATDCCPDCGKPMGYCECEGWDQSDNADLPEYLRKADKWTFDSKGTCHVSTK